MVAAAVALVVGAYGAGTWYSGDQAQKAFVQAVAELRHAVGDNAVVSDSYEKGFFSSQAKVSVEWTPPAPQADQAESQDAAEADDPKDNPTTAPATAAAPATPAVPGKPMRLVVNSDIRHGPIAGGKLAAATVQSQFALEGLDAEAMKPFAKANMPTLTGVRHFLGSSDWRLALPAGEVAQDGLHIRWADMSYDVAMGSDQKTLNGEFKWPELVVAGVPKPASDEEAMLDAEDEDEEDGEVEGGAADKAAKLAAAPAANGDKLNLTFKGMGGTFNYTMVDGLWGIGPGKTRMQVASAQVTNQKAGGQPEVVMDLQGIASDSTITAEAKTLSLNTQVQGTGRIGPLTFDSLGYEQNMQRLDVEVLRSFQQMVLANYKAGGLNQALSPSPEQATELLAKNAPLLLQALPAYQVKFKATYQGNAGELEYGVSVLKAPTAEQLAGNGWMPALIQGSAINASARLPKAWLANFAKASGKEVEPEHLDALVDMATGSGYVKAEGDYLTANLKVQDGKMNLNGVTKPLPMGFGG